jgi:hypothetical protein
VVNPTGRASRLVLSRLVPFRLVPSLLVLSRSVPYRVLRVVPLRFSFVVPFCSDLDPCSDPDPCSVSVRFRPLFAEFLLLSSLVQLVFFVSYGS